MKLRQNGLQEKESITPTGETLGDAPETERRPGQSGQGAGRGRGLGPQSRCE